MPIIIDVRSPEEFLESHKPDAINIPITDIMEGNLGILKNLPKDTEIQCYCASGARSAMVKQILNNEGFINIINLGGI